MSRLSIVLLLVLSGPAWSQAILMPADGAPPPKTDSIGIIPPSAEHQRKTRGFRQPPALESSTDDVIMRRVPKEPSSDQPSKQLAQ
jgi:hypothetical protein